MSKEIKRKVAKAIKLTENGYALLKEAQNECTHEKVSRVAKANTGNYDPHCDSYWYEFRCPTCEKFWIEDQ